MRPHSLFGLAKKRTGRARSKRKNAARWDYLSGFRKVSARGVVQAGVGRFGTPPCVDFRWRSMVASAGLGGQAFRCLPATTAGVYTRGKPIQRTRTARAGKRLENWWQFVRTAPVFKRTCALCASSAPSVLFFWTVHGPFSFRQERKENGGWNPLP